MSNAFADGSIERGMASSLLQEIQVLDYPTKRKWGGPGYRHKARENYLWRTEQQWFIRTYRETELCTEEKRLIASLTRVVIGCGDQRSFRVSMKYGIDERFSFSPKRIGDQMWKVFRKDAHHFQFAPK